MLSGSMSSSSCPMRWQQSDSFISLSSKLASLVAQRESVYNLGDLGSIPGSGRSSQEGHGNPLRYSCLENPMDRGAWQATVHGVAKSRTQDTTKRLTPSLSSSKHAGSYGTGKNVSSMKQKGNCNGNLFHPPPPPPAQICIS